METGWSHHDLFSAAKVMNALNLDPVDREGQISDAIDVAARIIGKLPK